MEEMRERKTITSCAQEAARYFDAVTVWAVCVIAGRYEVLAAGWAWT